MSNFCGVEGSQRRTRSGYCKEGLNAFEVMSTDAKSPRKKEANEDRKVKSSLNRKHFTSHSCIKSHHRVLAQIMLCFRLSKMEASLLVGRRPSRSIFHFSDVPIEKNTKVLSQQLQQKYFGRSWQNAIHVLWENTTNTTTKARTQAGQLHTHNDQQSIMTHEKQQKTTRRHKNLCVSFLKRIIDTACVYSSRFIQPAKDPDFQDWLDTIRRNMVSNGNNRQDTSFKICTVQVPCKGFFAEKHFQQLHFLIGSAMEVC